jgi:hypothetical protein
MTLLPRGTKVHLAFGCIDMRNGINGLAMLVQGILRQDPFSGHLSAHQDRVLGRHRPMPVHQEARARRGQHLADRLFFASFPGALRVGSIAPLLLLFHPHFRQFSCQGPAMHPKAARRLREVEIRMHQNLMDVLPFEVLDRCRPAGKLH